MALPLQPGRPWPRGWQVLIGLLGLLALLLALGVLGLERRPPIALLITEPGQPLRYARAAERAIASARHRVWVMQYVVRLDDGPVLALMEALAAARARGVEVRVVLDRGLMYGTTDPDLKNDRAGEWLQAHGIEVVWDEVASTSHAKLVLVDDAVVLLGSHNWTRAALTSNREVSMALQSPQEIEAIAQLFRNVTGWNAMPGNPGRD
jgi:phosphatidylserine/phosphatidylglycerophosphate/cardiolipin synthase-like enzyme